jgi:hypothetical protein
VIFIVILLSLAIVPRGLIVVTVESSGRYQDSEKSPLAGILNQIGICPSQISEPESFPFHDIAYGHDNF